MMNFSIELIQAAIYYQFIISLCIYYLISRTVAGQKSYTANLNGHSTCSSKNWGSVIALTATKIKKFLLFQNVQTGPEAHPASYAVGTEVKWLGHYVYHSCPPSVEVKNKWNNTYTSLYAFMAWTGTTSTFMCSSKLFKCPHKRLEHTNSGPTLGRAEFL
jgi:hypothetical protein